MINRLKNSARLIFVLFWISILFMIATNIQAGWLYVIMAFLGLLCVYSVIIPRMAMKKMKVRLYLPDMCEKGTAAQCRVELINGSKFSQFLVKVEFLDLTKLKFDPPGVVFIKIDGKSRASVSAPFIPEKRGINKIGRVRLSCGAPAGIFSVTKTIISNTGTLVHPQISGFLGQELEGSSGNEGSGKKERFFAIEDPYHYKLREYTPGDSLNRLHWKLTAKKNKPIVRVHERKIYGHSGIMIDNFADSYNGNEELFEDVLKKGISLAYHLLFVKGSSVSVAGTAAPEISLETPDFWYIALRWFAIIQLEQRPSGHISNTDSAMAEYNFAPDETLEAAHE